MNHLEKITDIKKNQVVLTDEREAQLIAEFKPLADRLEAATREAMNPVLNDNDAQRMVMILNAIKDDEVFVKNALPEVEQAHKAHKAWCKFRDVFADNLAEASKAIRRALVEYQTRIQQASEAERARLQAVEDAKVKAEQERLLARADKVKTESKKAELQAQAEMIAPVQIKVEKQKFIQTRKQWKVKSVDKKLLIESIKDNPSNIGFVDVNEAALRKAKITNPELELCGVKFEQVTI